MERKAQVLIMKNNLITEYEIIDGFAIVDNNFNIITANEEMFRFIGIGLSTYSSIVDIIHQVDLDDFIDVSNELRIGQSKSMVLRMRRCDNSYRWTLLEVSRHEHKRKAAMPAEYLELHISDVMALKRQNTSFKDSICNVRHFLSMENELFCTYDYETGILRINYFIDNEVNNLLELPLDDAISYFTAHNIIAEESLGVCNAICEDIHKGKVSFCHRFYANFNFVNVSYELFEIKCSTIYSDMQPKTAIGSIKKIDSRTGNTSSIDTFHFNQKDALLSYEEMHTYCMNNIKLNPNCELTLILMEINGMDEYEATEGSEFVETLYHTTLETAKKQVKYRGIVCEIQKNLISIVVRDINSEINVRAFIGSLRSQIAWNYKLIDSKYDISFSFGIARYPENGKDLSIVNRKLVKALQLAKNKHQNCYVIYKEHLHGEL